MAVNIHVGGDAVRRREEILNIVRESPVHSQEALLTVLRSRGFTVTQPTLSRDLREIGMAKSPAGYVAPGTPGNVTAFTPRETLEERFNRLVRDSVISAESACNMLVIRTPIAAAQPVASALDAASFPEVMGTIGGDDTIFVALASEAAALAFAERVRHIAGITPVRRTRE